MASTPEVKCRKSNSRPSEDGPKGGAAYYSQGCFNVIAIRTARRSSRSLSEAKVSKASARKVRESSRQRELLTTSGSASAWGAWQFMQLYCRPSRTLEVPALM